MSEASGDLDKNLNETVTIMVDLYGESIESTLNDGSGDDVVKPIEETIWLANSSSFNRLITCTFVAVTMLLMSLWLLTVLLIQYQYAMKKKQRRRRRHAGDDQIEPIYSQV